MPKEMRDTLTTSRSNILNQLRQKEPRCRKAPNTVIWGLDDTGLGLRPEENWWIGWERVAENVLGVH